MRPGALLAAALACAASAPAARAGTVSVWAAGGVAWSAPTPVEIRQRGEPALAFTGRWDTRALRAPPYYVLGVGWRGEQVELTLELVHHKLHLRDPPPEVGRLWISHGYNLVVAGYGRALARRLWLRGGGGVVIAHPESQVRGRELDEGQGPFGLGYHLSGVAAHLGLEWRAGVAGPLFAAVGARVTGAWAVVPVAGGTADVPNLAAHATAGLGLELW